MSGEDNSWRAPSFRQNVVQKIEEAVRTSGMNPSKNSLEMENHVYQKAKTKEDYLSYVARLILHVREMDGCRFPIFIESWVLKKADETPEEVKELGNIFFTKKMYTEALMFYTKAINLDSESALFYGNRTACYMMLGDYKKAVADATTSVQLNPSFVKGHARLLKCYILLGEASSASEALDKIIALEGSSDIVKNEVESLESLKTKMRLVLKAIESKEYPAAINFINSALTIATHSSSLKLMKAECQVYTGQFDEAKRLANEINDSESSGAFFIVGLCFYYQGSIDMAITYFKTIVPVSPSSAKVHDFYKQAMEFQRLKAEGNKLFELNQFVSASNSYTSALNIDPSNKAANSKLYFNRGTCHFKLNNLKEAVADYSKAIDFDNNYLKALSRRGQCYVKMSEYEKAVFDFEKVYRAEPSVDNRRLLDDAKASLTRSKRKDYYKILDVTRKATLDEIKKAYRKKALVHHPDRHVNSSESEKVEEEKKFKQLGEAYAILSDPVKKADYDRTICLFATPHTPYHHHSNASAFAQANVSAYVARASTFLKIGSYAQARDAAMEAMKQDPNCLNAYIIILKCHIATGDVGSADAILLQIRRNSRFPQNPPDYKVLEKLKAFKSNAEKFMHASNYIFAAKVIEDARKIAPASDLLKLWKAECLIYLNQDNEAMRVIDTINLPETHYLTFHLLYIRGLSCYVKGELDRAIFILTSRSARPSSLVYAKKCEELAQRAHKLKAMKEAANAAYSRESYKEAITLYSKALQMDGQARKYNSVIFANRGAAHYQLKDLKLSIKDCSEALKLDPSYQKALLRRAQCYFELGDFAIAHNDYRKLFALSKDPEHKKLMEQALEKVSGDISVTYIDDEDEDDSPRRKKRAPRQTRMSDFIGKNLRKRTRKNYKIDSGSEEKSDGEKKKNTKNRKEATSDESDTDEKKSKKKRKATSSEESDSDEKKNAKKSKVLSSDESENSSKGVFVSKTRGGSKTSKASPTKKSSEKASTARSTRRNTRSRSETRKRNLRGKKGEPSSDESSPEEISVKSSSDSESSDSEEVFVKKTVGGKKSKARSDSDSDGVDLSEIKNSYKTRVVSSTKKFSMHKYKKVVGGGAAGKKK